MSTKHIGRQTVALASPPSIIGSAAVVGKKEGDGPLRDSFDYINEDSFFGESSWEKAESAIRHSWQPPHPPQEPQFPPQEQPPLPWRLL